MKDRFNNIILDDGRFDRLVDGELSAADYKALLTTLDEEPAGWRRCAMAFLEAQAWRREMSAIRQGQESAPAPKPTHFAAASGRWRWLPLLAVAASFVVAFLGGLAVQRQLDRRGQAVNDAGALGHQQSVNPQGDGASVEGPLLAGDSAASEQESQPLGNIRLIVDGGQGRQSEQIDVPVYDLNQVGSEWLTQDEPSLSPQVVESLKRLGRKVERQVEYLPLPLDDEHQIVVPVEQYQITPVSRRSL